MKKILVIVFLAVLSFMVGFASAQDVRQDGWDYIRKVVSAADTDTLGATNSDWGQRKTYSHGTEIPTNTEAILVSVIGNHASDPDDGTVSIKFYMYRSGGVAQVVGTYAFTFGDLRVNLKPKDSTQQGAKSKWAESATETSQNWISRPEIVGSGTDTCVMLKIPTYGAAYVAAEVTAITAAHTADVLMSALSTGFSDSTVTVDNGSGTDAVEVQMTSPVKSSAVDVVDAWQTVTAATAVVGSVGDLSDAYGDSILYVEVAQIEAVAHAGGSGPVVQVSYTDDDWVDYWTLSLTADTAATTTTVGAVTDANTVVDLTDASTGDFDVVARKWFIKDGTIANSETVYTVSETGNAVTLASGCIRSHASGVSVYDRVDDFAVSIPEGVTKVRMLWNNTDADCDIAVTCRLNKVTAR